MAQTFIADLHIHSRFSRATSRALNLEELDFWAQRKGLAVVGTGDFTHPGWLSELEECLEPAEHGLYRLKPDLRRPVRDRLPPACRGDVRFILQVEISSIYKRDDRVRKVHNLVFVPDFETVHRFRDTLGRIGNLCSDGRPILGLDSRDLLEITLESSDRAVLIPAHIWTPWFSVLGSKSGFDNVESCFGDLTRHIFAVETGLSSDPPMNWRLSGLDRFTLVSNSDAHSASRLAREANIFHTEFSYDGIFDALRSSDPERCLGTVEFFPEEGKYHYDGHRKCDRRMTPEETLSFAGLCPDCGKPVTVGVMHRVEELADREPGERSKRALPYHSLVGLPQVLGEVMGVGPGSKRVMRRYESLLEQFGTELHILLELPRTDLEQTGDTLLAEGVRRIRAGEFHIAAGYDGEYGKITLFTPDERDRYSLQLAFSGANSRGNQTSDEPAGKPVSPTMLMEPGFKVESRKPEFSSARSMSPESGGGCQMVIPASGNLLEGLNDEQREAVRCTGRPLLIMAGPGTGKTRTLIHRVAYLINRCHVPPKEILALTFTNRAADEMRERLAVLLDQSEPDQGPAVSTFHSFAVLLLREEGTRTGIPDGFTILDAEESNGLLRHGLKGLLDGPMPGIRAVDRALAAVERARREFADPGEMPGESVDFGRGRHLPLSGVVRLLDRELREAGAVDVSGLIPEAVALLEQHPEVLSRWQCRYRWISVDEYQDIDPAQYRLLRLLAPPAGANVCAIGDPDQAIYGFRGADTAFFKRFEDDRPDALVVTLSRNYRSTQTILESSNQLIHAGDGDEKHVKVFSGISGEPTLKLIATPSAAAEAVAVVREVDRLLGGVSHHALDSGWVDGHTKSLESGFAEMAVLYRTERQSPALVEAFTRSGIPFQKLGGRKIRSGKVERRLRSALRLLLDGDNRMDLARLGVSHLSEIPVLARLARLVDRRPLETLVEEVLQLAEIRGSKKDEPSAAGKDELGAGRRDEERLLTLARTCGRSISLFLERLALNMENDEYDHRADRVSLMTMHAAKGLEFDVVFIAGCEDGLIPYRHQADQDRNLAEERRIFYVAMTRARKLLYLTRARKRRLFGRSGACRPSPFLLDIEQRLIERSAVTPVRGRRKKGDTDGDGKTNQLSLFQ